MEQWLDRTDAFNLQDFANEVRDQLTALPIGEEVRRWPGGPGGPQHLRIFVGVTAVTVGREMRSKQPALMSLKVLECDGKRRL